MTVSFAERWSAVVSSRGAFCLGIDPLPEVLRAWGLPDSAQGLKAFADTIASACAGMLSMVKPQSACFERFGPDGLRILQELTGRMHEQGTLVLLDAKRGDISSTNGAYAEALLGPGSALSMDAITVHPYLGVDALKPFIERCVAVGTAIFVVVRSSNPEGWALQDARVASGGTVIDSLCDSIRRANLLVVRDGIGPVNAVVGATHPDAGATAERLSNSLILSPGLGAQGGNWSEVHSRFGSSIDRIIPTSARSVLLCGPDPGQLRSAIETHQKTSIKMRSSRRETAPTGRSNVS